MKIKRRPPFAKFAKGRPPSRFRGDEKRRENELADVLMKYGAPLGKELRGAALANYIVARGADVTE